MISLRDFTKGTPSVVEYLFIFSVIFSFTYPAMIGDTALYSVTWYSSLLSGFVGFLIVSLSLRRRGLGLERTFLGLATVVGSAWIFQTIWRYAFVSTLSYLPANAVQLTSNSYIVGPSFSLPVALMSASLPLIGVRLMSFTKWSGVLWLATAAIFSLWMAVGYPQVFGPKGFLFLKPLFTASPEQIPALGAAMYFAAKVSTYASVASLFIGKHSSTGMFH